MKKAAMKVPPTTKVETGRSVGCGRKGAESWRRGEVRSGWKRQVRWTERMAQGLDGRWAQSK